MVEREGEQSEVTRDLRRSFFLAQHVELAMSELKMALPGLSHEDEDRLRRTLVRHLELAWNDGALREADLRTALATETTLRKRVQAELHVALKRISDMR